MNAIRYFTVRDKGVIMPFVNPKVYAEEAFRRVSEVIQGMAKLGKENPRRFVQGTPNVLSQLRPDIPYPDNPKVLEPIVQQLAAQIKELISILPELDGYILTVQVFRMESSRVQYSIRFSHSVVVELIPYLKLGKKVLQSDLPENLPQVALTVLPLNEGAQDTTG